MKIKDNVVTGLNLLEKEYPDARITLDFKTPLQLLTATILAAQCTDERVNRVTPALFKKYRTAQDFSRAQPEELEDEIRSTGFFRNKGQEHHPGLSKDRPRLQRPGSADP